MAIPQTFIQELLARTDVVEIVGRYVQLKKGGANFMGLCPFHGEKSPSFSVSPTKQFYHCFGCGKNGNAIGFLMDHAGMTFIDEVEMVFDWNAAAKRAPQGNAWDWCENSRKRFGHGEGRRDLYRKGCNFAEGGRA